METVIIRCKESVNNSDINPLGMAHLKLSSNKAVTTDINVIDFADGAGKIYSQNGVVLIENGYKVDTYSQEVASGLLVSRRLQFVAAGEDVVYFPRRVSSVGTYTDLTPNYGGFMPGYLSGAIDEKFLLQFDSNCLKTLLLSNSETIDPSITSDVLFDMFPNLEVLGLHGGVMNTLRVNISRLAETKCRRFFFLPCLMYGDYAMLPEDMISLGSSSAVGGAFNDELRYSGGVEGRQFLSLKSFLGQMPCKVDEGVNFLKMLNASDFPSGIRMTLYKTSAHAEYTELLTMLKNKIETLNGVFYCW